MRLGELLRELLKHVGVVDIGLVREYFVAVFVAQRLAPGIEPTRVDGRVRAPQMAGNQKIVAYPGNLVLRRGSLQDGIGMRAGWAFQIVELDDRNMRARRRLERGGIENLGWGGLRGQRLHAEQSHGKEPGHAKNREPEGRKCSRRRRK